MSKTKKENKLKVGYWVEVGDDKNNHIPTLHYGKDTWSDPERAMKHLIERLTHQKEELIEEIGKLKVTGTNIPLWIIWEDIENSYSIEDVLEMHPTLKREEIEGALKLKFFLKKKEKNEKV